MIHPKVNASLIERFTGPTWGPSGTDRTQVGPMLVPWTLLSGILSIGIVLFNQRRQQRKPYQTINLEYRALKTTGVFYYITVSDATISAINPMVTLWQGNFPQYWSRVLAWTSIEQTVDMSVIWNVTVNDSAFDQLELFLHRTILLWWCKLLLEERF